MPRVSEELVAEVDLVGIPLGSLRNRTCPESGRGAVRVVTEMSTAPLLALVRDITGRAHTFFAPGRLTPTRSEYGFEEANLLRHYKVRHRSGVFDHVYDNGGRARRKGRAVVPAGAFPHDLHSAVIALRKWRPRLGESRTMFAVLGRRLWRVEYEFQGTQVILHQGQPRVTYRIDGHAVRLRMPKLPPRERRFSVWLDEGPERVPLRLVAASKLGEVAIRLTSRQTGAPACGGKQRTDEKSLSEGSRG